MRVFLRRNVPPCLVEVSLPDIRRWAQLHAKESTAYVLSDVLCKYRRGAREINEIDGCHQRKRLSKKLHGSFRKSVPSAEAMPRDLVPSSRSATVSARTM